MIALAIAIGEFFGYTGERQTAHELGVGLLLSWLAILVLSSITDRNPVAADETRRQLNSFLELVRIALLDSERRVSYITTLGTMEDEFAWTKFLEDDDYLRDAFFTQFAGQGRVRWHVSFVIVLKIDKTLLTTAQTGCANPVISSIEHAWIADHGRGWMGDPDRARTRIILGDTTKSWSFNSFDRPMFWQIAWSTAIFYGTAGGAFTLACESNIHRIRGWNLLKTASLYPDCWSWLLVGWLPHLYNRRHRHLCDRDPALVVPSNLS